MFNNNIDNIVKIKYSLRILEVLKYIVKGVWENIY